jgi:hypothetical protein
MRITVGQLKRVINESLDTPLTWSRVHNVATNALFDKKNVPAFLAVLDAIVKKGADPQQVAATKESFKNAQSGGAAEDPFWDVLVDLTDSVRIF